MMKKAEIKEQYMTYCREAAETVYYDVSTWENRRNLFQGAYALGWVLGIADIDTDEEISDGINFLRTIEKMHRDTGLDFEVSFGKANNKVTA